MTYKERLLTVGEAADVLGISKRTLYQWSWLNKYLHFVKIGSALRISERDLMEFIEQRRRSPKSD